ncbi:MAG: DNA adenine methylase [Acidobacteriota bacterium]|nr:DNA adenine methylase [Acidobacteriota bacterium]
MGSKHRLLPWIHEILWGLKFDSALDAFSGSGCVAYLLKAMGKKVMANDFLSFASIIAEAAVANSDQRLSSEHIEILTADKVSRDRFIEKTFSGIFFESGDLRFLDNVWANLPALPSGRLRALALAALIRSCLKRQPRGVFTVADPERYKDGRRDLTLTLEEHFVESVKAFNRAVFDSGRPCRATRRDIFEIEPLGYDLVYMDPPYVPRADDNCYIKRYHFLEGLATYWKAEDAEILETSKVKKIKKRFTPFSYRRTALAAFDRMFSRFGSSILVLSYSSNGYPDLETLVSLMRRYKSSVRVFETDHRYHFGTHRNVSPDRAAVREYLIVGV